MWKITILRQKIIFFPILGGGRAPGAPPSGSAPETEVNIMEVMNGTAKTSADEQMFVDLPTKIVDENINLNRI